MKHKHAEVLNAIAEGKTVQWERNSRGGTQTGVWVDFNPDVNGSPLDLCGRQFNWRIKPEPKPDEVRYLNCNPYYESFKSTKAQYWCDNLKLTFDGETGKLIKAEVL